MSEEKPSGMDETLESRVQKSESLASMLPKAFRVVSTSLLLCRIPRTRVAHMCAQKHDQRAILLRILQDQAESQNRKHLALLKEKEAVQKANAYTKWAKLVVQNLWKVEPGMKTLTVQDWENDGRPVTLKFDLDNYETPHDEAEAAFAKARRYKRGSHVVNELIQACDVTRERLESWIRKVELLDSDADVTSLAAIESEVLSYMRELKLKLPKPEISKKNPEELKKDLPRKKKNWSGRRFTSPSGLTILVGRNKSENEELSLRIARHPDVWMHVRESPGAHVVLRVSSDVAIKPTREDYQMAADLAAFYSDLKNERKALVVYASPKHVTKPKGAPVGAVQIREELGSWVGIPLDVRDMAAAELRERKSRADDISS